MHIDSNTKKKKYHKITHQWNRNSVICEKWRSGRRSPTNSKRTRCHQSQEDETKLLPLHTTTSHGVAVVDGKPTNRAIIDARRNHPTPLLLMTLPPQQPSTVAMKN